MRWEMGSGSCLAFSFRLSSHAFAQAGKRLMELHVEYEKQEPYALEEIEDPKADVSFRVEKMKLSLRLGDSAVVAGEELLAGRGDLA
ncbi:MAG: hypothetical protein ACYCSN_09545 [Acidobacteriaceae bacterium]